MALSASALAGIIQSNLEGVGANGSNLSKFCNAVAAGIVMSIVGQSFVTSDVGTVPGVGSGVGTGIMGLSSSSMESTALGIMTSQGVNAAKLMNAIMTGVVSHLSSAASLMSVDTPVYLGAGTIVVGSITVVAATMSANIQSQLASQGARGVNMPNLSLAIGTGVATGILSSGTGNLTITGSPTGSPGPGTGSGTGTIS